MSTPTTLAELEKNGLIERYSPVLRKALKRRLYLTEQAKKDFHDPKSATNILAGQGFIIAAFDKWISGGRIYGSKRNGRFLDRLDKPPPEIWELRVTEPIVQVRLIGRFAEPDTLVLTNFHTRTYLDKRGSTGWKHAMDLSVAEWVKAFDKIPPFSGAKVGDYVTENCDEFEI